MRFALTFAAVTLVMLVAGRADACQFKATRVEEPGAKLVVRVVALHLPAAPQEVEVRVVPVGETTAESLQIANALDHLERGRLEAALAKARPVAAKLDEPIDLPRPACPFVVVASAPGWWCERIVRGSESTPLYVALHADRSLAVRVLDGRGRPVAHVPVAIVDHIEAGSQTSLPDVLPLRETIFQAVVPTSDRDGIARFAHLQEWLDPFSYRDNYVALLAVPHRDHEQVWITPPLLANGSGIVELQAPPFGSVELHFPGVVTATVRLRERARTPPSNDRRDVGPGDWRLHEPLELEVIDGVARCDRIGIECRLEIEARWNGLQTPFHAEFEGPARPGESVTWSLAADGDAVRAAVASLTGRVVDAQKRPMASRSLGGRLLADWHDSEAARACDEFRFVTDANGRFELTLAPRAPVAGENWWLEIVDPTRGEGESPFPARLWIDLTERLGAGRRDLGDQAMVGADAKARIVSLKDDELLSEYGAMRGWPSIAVETESGFDARLNEMARRGGARFADLLEREIARRNEEKKRSLGGDNAPSDAVDLEWAVLLRQAQRRPAPLALEPVTAVCESVTGEPLDLKVRIHDVDPGFKCLAVPQLFYGLFTGRWRITVLHDGQRLPELLSELAEETLAREQFWVPSTDLKNDQSCVESVPLGSRLDHARPGEYRVRVEFLIANEPALTSRDLVVRIRPVPIRVRRRDYDAMVAWIRAIDVVKPVALTSLPLGPTDRFDGEPKTPEDRLFRCGRTALPALLDELSATTDEPRRRAWILGLLWNLHVADSITVDQIEAAVGPHEWSNRWSTVHADVDVDPLVDRSRNLDRQVDRFAGITRDLSDPLAVQRELAAIWTEKRGWYEFIIEE